jgi:uncharacterized protein YndB with AHSA1/START domain
VSTSTDTTLRLTRVIKAAPATVFSAWTEPAQLRQWSCPEGMELPDVQVDLRVGGSLLLDMLGEDGVHHTAFGEYREIDAPHRLVYTWDWKQEGDAMGETLITVEFNPHGEHTEVVMTHEKMPSIELKDAHDHGWTSCLDRLEKLFSL